jgi:hypothetical protein
MKTKEVDSQKARDLLLGIVVNLRQYLREDSTLNNYFHHVLEKDLQRLFYILGDESANFIDKNSDSVLGDYWGVVWHDCFSLWVTLFREWRGVRMEYQKDGEPIPLEETLNTLNKWLKCIDQQLQPAPAPPAGEPSKPQPITKAYIGGKNVFNRDKWLYEQCCKQVVYSTILIKLNSKPESWPRLNSISALKKSANKYAVTVKPKLVF